MTTKRNPWPDSVNIDPSKAKLWIHADEPSDGSWVAYATLAGAETDPLDAPYSVTLPLDDGGVRHVSYWHEPDGGAPLTVRDAHDVGIAAQLEAHARGVPWAAAEGDDDER